MNVVITGASRGIGKAIAEVFADAGYQLFLSSRNDTALYKCAEDLSTRFPQAVIKARAFDLSRKEEAIQCGEWVLSSGLVPDILVNNAGSFEPGSVYNEPDNALERQIETNLYSAYHLSRTLIPEMMKNGKGRHIFNMCSIASLDAYPNGGAYSISKFALYGFSKNLREEMKKFGIKVTAILPGAVMTDSWEGFDNSESRIMLASDIAQLVWSASKLSPQACVEDILIRPQLGDL